MLKAIILTICCFLTPAFAFGQSQLENPRPGAQVSGISLISGWKCSGGTITIRFDGLYLFTAVYGTTREDTQSICGDDNNGWGLLFNWNLLGTGQHTVEVFDNGALFASATFTVQTLGEEFRTDLSKTVIVPDFPEPGQTATLRWQESLQNFTIASVTTNGDPEDLAALLGVWEFEYTVDGSEFSQIYDLEEIDSSTGSPVIRGFDELGDPIITARVEDLISEPFPYTFALLDPGVTLCRLFVFNQNSANVLSGLYLQLPVLSDGECGTSFSNEYPLTAARLSPSQSAALAIRSQEVDIAELHAVARPTSLQASTLPQEQLTRLIRRLQP